MEPFIQESGRMELEKGKVCKPGLTVRSMKDIGRTTKQMVMANYSMLMVIFMKVNGKTIKLMDKENIFIKMEQHTMEVGRKTNNMGMGERHGLMEPNMKEIILKAKRMKKEYYILQMAQSTLANSV
jgi:ATP-dependent protease HslVU (ClpYQ) ATPase subunit